VKFAVAHLFKATEIDLVLSGINLGENAGMSAVYSGTVAAAREGAMWGIPSIAVSVWHNAPERLTHAVDWILRLLRKPSRLPQRPGGLWNVNFPPCAPSEIKGALVTRMSTVMFRDTYEAVRTEHGLTEFRLVGYKPQDEFVAGTDDWALAQGRISITPLKVSQSDGAEADRLAALGADWGVP
jgi:5'-nucleotidase